VNSRAEVLSRWTARLPIWTSPHLR
jgi:hypothetical protein